MRWSWRAWFCLTVLIPTGTGLGATLADLRDGRVATLTSMDGSVVLSAFTYDGPDADTIDLSPDPLHPARFVLTGRGGTDGASAFEVTDDTDLTAVLAFSAAHTFTDFTRITYAMTAQAVGTGGSGDPVVPTSITVQLFADNESTGQSVAEGVIFAGAIGPALSEAALPLDPNQAGDALRLETHLNLLAVPDGTARITDVVYEFAPPRSTGGDGDGSGGDPAPFLHLRVNPSVFTICTIGDVQPLTVTAIFSDGSTQDWTDAATGTTYTTADASIAQVSTNGVVTAVGEGNTAITVRNRGHTTTATATLDPNCGLPPTPRCTEPDQTLAALAFTSADLTLDVGATFASALIGLDCDGRLIEGLESSPDTVFTSTDPSVLRVDPDGVLTAVAQGQAEITAENDGASADLAVTVIPVEPGGGQEVPPDGTVAGNRSSARVLCGSCGTLGIVDGALWLMGGAALCSVTRRRRTHRRTCAAPTADRRRV